MKRMRKQLICMKLLLMSIMQQFYRNFDNEGWDNDSAFDYLMITDDNDFVFAEHDFLIEEGDDLGWVGYFIGRSTTLQNFRIESLAAETISVHRLGDLIEGLTKNRSIKTLHIGADLGSASFRQMGDCFNNNSLRELSFGNMDTSGLKAHAALRLC